MLVAEGGSMRRIAVVEDSPVERDSLLRFLDRYATDTGATFDVTPFESGEEFLTAHKAFDLVFLDIEMPGLDGMETAAMWRSYCPDTPLIFVTNLAQYALRGYEVDAFGFLVKPVSYRAFARNMDKISRLMNLQDMEAVLVPTKSGVHSILRRSLVYIEVFDHDLIYHLSDGQEDIRARGYRAGASSTWTT